ncbi:NADPH:quinone reductase-like Zn-dependent oxidoreductase [Microbacterium terrae]|uniref:Quinone oxidoreductase 1 n=1 Tax=Microbacterium terrae TaxID=69369 RepID=A0A0M2H9N2_9MICO|nr:NADP-dependent oxidoreductase [Microbacterium terrae]KJL43297.1 Quinone oxidoreductase 1 [Microbacterium terrae]MBP1078498.1 NADPH:quinone reductase-like Zn-dependent oxidoreductase [Microbacterium terrae]GLJ97899.1 NADPH:quinone reductase [Microbacterium terrae]
MKTKTIEATAYRYTRYGDADVLKAHVFPLDPPLPGEVTVEVIATGINHMEAFLRNGREQTWMDDGWPRSSGSDFTGVVRAVGPGGRLSRGDEVIGHVRTGAHATHLNVAESRLVAKPRTLTWEAAGGLFLAGATATTVLDDLSIGPDDTVVVSAAAGGVGSIETQLAKSRGARVIGTCGDRNFDYLRQLGIHPVRYGDGMVDRIRQAARGPVTACIDNFGKDGAEIAAALDVPAERHLSSADRRQVELDLLSDGPEAVARATEILRTVAGLAASGAFRTLVSGLYPLDEITAAYEDLERLHSRGKIVLATHPVTPFSMLRARELFETMP